VEIVVSVLLTAMVAVAAWFGTHFAGNPFIKFYLLREKIHESLFFTANVGADHPGFDKAVEELRRHGAALDAMRVTLPCFPKWYLIERQGFRLEDAVSGITGLSNSLGNTVGEKAIHRNKIEHGLNLPRTYTDEQMNGINAALSGGNSLLNRKT